MKDARIKIELLVHDLKGPLSVIEANIRLLMEKTEKYGPLTEKQKKLLCRVLRNSQLAQRRVSDALEIGRSEAGATNPDEVGIGEIVSNCLVETFELSDHQFHEELHIGLGLPEIRDVLRNKSVELNIEERLWSMRFRIDREKTEQILRNLLSNALKYRKNAMRIGGSHEDGVLVFSVTDDGAGIPPEYHRKIFEKYFRIEDKGTGARSGHGIGLSGALVLAIDMGGELYLQSGAGQGASFVLSIPAEPLRQGL